MRISPARTAAYDILFAIEIGRGRSSDLLPKRTSELSEADRRLCYEIVLGVLRRKLYLQRLVGSLSQEKKLDIEVLITLLIGLYQLLYLDRVPPHSAVNESVELVARARKASARGFVNAVLRRGRRGKPKIEFQDKIDEVSVTTSHPRWLVERWVRQFGIDRAFSICEANNQPPRLSFRLTVRALKSFGGSSVESDTVISWLEEQSGVKIAKSLVAESGFIAAGVTPGLRRLSNEGMIYFQDEASQLVAESVSFEQNTSFLDICAAPGGKTTLIAAKDNGTKGILVAAEFLESRLRLLSEICRKQSVDVAKVQADALAPPFSEYSFDIILADVPCSGTGTIRHNPEIRYRLMENDFIKLFKKQLGILEEASKCVRAGGQLIYSTCSLENDENENAVEKFLERNPDFSVVRANVPERFVGQGNLVRTFPDIDGTDGFFLARMVRRA